MLSRFERNVQTGVRTEILQIVYRNENDDTIILDKGVIPPNGFIEYTGDLSEKVEPTE